MFLKNFPPSCKMKKRNEKSNTGETVKDKRDRTASDDAGGFLIGWRGFPDPKEEMNKEDTHTPHTHTHYLLTH